MEASSDDLSSGTATTAREAASIAECLFGGLAASVPACALWMGTRGNILGPSRRGRSAWVPPLLYSHGRVRDRHRSSVIGEIGDCDTQRRRLLSDFDVAERVAEERRGGVNRAECPCRRWAASHNNVAESSPDLTTLPSPCTGLWERCWFGFEALTGLAIGRRPIQGAKAARFAVILSNRTDEPSKLKYRHPTSASPALWLSARPASW